MLSDRMAATGESVIDVAANEAAACCDDNDDEEEEDKEEDEAAEESCSRRLLPGKARAGNGAPNPSRLLPPLFAALWDAL
jgi:hypothetical protein